jgi:hypothetical protein
MFLVIVLPVIFVDDFDVYIPAPPPAVLQEIVLLDMFPDEYPEYIPPAAMGAALLEIVLPEMFADEYSEYIPPPVVVAVLLVIVLLESDVT